MLNDMKMIIVYVILWGHMFNPVLKKSMGGGFSYNLFWVEENVTLSHTKGNVTIGDKVKTFEQNYR